MADEKVVAIAASERAGYGPLAEPVSAPELPHGRARTVALAAVRELLQTWGLDGGNAGSAAWNPLGEFIVPGARVAIKPNWVTHRNHGGGMDCLVTHTEVIAAVLEYVALARPGTVVVGDAPIQGCDFAALRESCGLDPMIDDLRGRGLQVKLADFRRTILEGGEFGGARQEAVQSEKEYVLFDLAGESLLELMAGDADRFRVTMYDPERMRQTHRAGRHQYLVAREVMEADVVLNLPKLKTHRKAGITGALKNLVGINGNKEYLPHHRKGGSSGGGDCYVGRSALKSLAEELLDAANRSRPGRAQAWLAGGVRLAVRGASLMGLDENLDGAWHGNDTVWRMCLDLQRILHYGTAAGTMAETRQRRVVTITDAIVAGEGEGPLSPEPVGTGVVTGATNTAAADWVHARLMGFDPGKIPLVRHAFDRFRYGIASFEPAAIRVSSKGGECAAEGVNGCRGVRFRAPRGWQGKCEREPDHDFASNR